MKWGAGLSVLCVRRDLVGLVVISEPSQSSFWCGSLQPGPSSGGHLEDCLFLAVTTWVEHESAADPASARTGCPMGTFIRAECSK